MLLLPLYKAMELLAPLLAKADMDVDDLIVSLSFEENLLGDKWLVVRNVISTNKLGY